MFGRLRVRFPAESAGESSPELTLCADTRFGVRSTLVLPQLHVKDPDYFAESADGKLQLNTHTFLARRSRNGLTVLSWLTAEVTPRL